MPADNPTELSRIKLKLELDSPSLWSAKLQPAQPHCHLAFAPGSGDIHDTCLLLLISMLWHRQAIFESKVKVDKLSSSAECRIRSQSQDIKSPADWMPAGKPTELSRIKLKLDLHSPFLWSVSIQPTRPTANWLSHLALAISMFTVVNIDFLAQASNIWIKCRPVVFLRWMQDSYPGSQTPNCQQIECLLTNRLRYRGSS